MHQIAISPETLTRAKMRRGEDVHVFLNAMEPAKTAHIVVDMQNGFMEAGAPAEVPEARGIVSNINAISAAVREAGGINVFLRMVIDAESLASWSNFYRAMSLPEITEATTAALTVGQHYWELSPDLDVTESDLKVDKKRFSAFVPGTCDLQEILQARGIDTVIITGTLTNFCCESTARDAMQRNYRVLFLADATAARSDEEHNATLNTMAEVFCDVVTTGELVGKLKTLSR